MNDWLRVTAIGGDDYECRMTVLKADDTTITVTRPWHHHWTDGWDWKDHHPPMVVQRAGNVRTIRRIGRMAARRGCGTYRLLALPELARQPPAVGC